MKGLAKHQASVPEDFLHDVVEGAATIIAQLINVYHDIWIPMLIAERIFVFAPTPKRIHPRWFSQDTCAMASISSPCTSQESPNRFFEASRAKGPECKY
jgi:hypothetical protein